MKNCGKEFEKDFKSSVNEDLIYFLRIQDNASSFGQDSAFVRFTIKNPYDNFCFFNKSLFPLELKASSGNSFTIQRSKDEKGKMIKLHQIEGLTKADRHEGVYAGFLFNFINTEVGKDNEVYWMSIKEFNNFLQETTKKSISRNDILKCDVIKVEATIKRVRYKYNIEKLLSDIIEKMR